MIRVIGAGFGRTGTKSLQKALEILGLGPCYHMGELIHRTKDIPFWLGALRGSRIDWPELLAAYSAIVDWPGCTFYIELLEAFPDAKVILTVRDPDLWHESVLSTIYRESQNVPTMWRLTQPRLWRWQQLVKEVVWQHTFAGRFEEKQEAIRIFLAHADGVRRAIPRERLLEFDVRDGWEPLCRFLGTPIPDVPFPSTNQNKQIHAQWSGFENEGKHRLVGILAVATVLAVLLLLRRLGK